MEIYNMLIFWGYLFWQNWGVILLSCSAVVALLFALSISVDVLEIVINWKYDLWTDEWIQGK